MSVSSTNPRFATVDSLRNIYVADSFNDRVQVFDNAGNYQFEFGSLGTQPGQFDKPYGIAVDDPTGNIFVVDRDNERIQVFDSSGNFLTTFGSEGSGPGQLNRPTAMVIGDGRLYVTEEYGHRVSVFRLGPAPPDYSAADFNGDSLINCRDVDLLVSEIVGGYQGTLFDLTDDGVVDEADLGEWLILGGGANTVSGNPYLPGDANLDGGVDVPDFNVWNGNKFTATGTAGWCGGDFNADGVVDVADFNIWNGNKFTSSDLTAVPEPRTQLWLFVTAFCLSLGVARGGPDTGGTLLV